MGMVLPMTPFSFSVSAMSVGEQYRFNIKIRTQLEGHGLVIQELYQHSIRLV